MLNNKTVKIDSQGRPRDPMGNHASSFLGYPPEKDKGEYMGSCNMTSCQAPFAIGKHSNGRWYCVECATRINRACARDEHWIPIQIDEKAKAEMMDKI